MYTGGKRRMPEGKCALVAGVLKRRILGEPLQYILGRTEFMGIDFRVTPDVLIPRPETEILVETALRYAKIAQDAPRRVLDIGTGSGCLAISLARHLPQSLICATDISAAALRVAEENASANGCRIDFLNADLFPQGDRMFDMIVSNPPYIPEGQIASLQREVLYEPRGALCGGADGLDFYRRICSGCCAHLSFSGYLIMEVGYGQAEDVRALIRSTPGMCVEETVSDYAGIERVIVTRRQS